MKLSFKDMVNKLKPKEEESVLIYNENGEVDPDAVLREKDRESKFRKLTGFWKYLIMAVSVIFVFYHLYTSRFGMPIVNQHRAFHVGVIMFLAFAYYPFSKKSDKTKPTWWDILMMLLVIVSTVYTIWNVTPLALRGGVANTTDIIIGTITCLLVLEATRRVLGSNLVILAMVFLLYAYFGRYMPGVFSHRGYSFQRIIHNMYLTSQGIYGLPVGVSSTYLVIFVILGSVLDKSGLGTLFNDVSLALGGRLVGGPAKVSVIASALMGTINGSAATNVATTGAFTIPLMKRVGYKPHFAGAVEAAASTGGQIMPPIMGTCAFIMAEYLGVPYLSIAAAAVIPALLYFMGVFFQIDLRSRKNGLTGLDKSELPDVKATIKRYGLLFIPILVLIYLMIDGFTPLYAAFYATVLTWALALIRPETRLGPKRIAEMCVNASRSIISVGIAMACAGFIVAVLSMTGLGIILADNIKLLSNGHLVIALFLTMVVAIILGMGLPTSACYIISSTIAVPILTSMDVPLFEAHFFVMYYSVLSTITPPVALASYVGAGMAGASTSKVGWTAFRLALAGFIVPFFFVYNPAMLLIADSTFTIIQATITGLLGTYLLAVGIEGYMFKKLNVIFRVLYLVAALTCLIPGTLTDVIGLGLGAVLTLYLWYTTKRVKPVAA